MLCSSRSLMNGQGQAPSSGDAGESAPVREPSSPTSDTESSPRKPPRRFPITNCFGALATALMAMSGWPAAKPPACCAPRKLSGGVPLRMTGPSGASSRAFNGSNKSPANIPASSRSSTSDGMRPTATFYYVMELADQVVAADVRRLTSEESEARNPTSECKSEPPDVGSPTPLTLCALIWNMAGFRPRACWKSAWP